VLNVDYSRGRRLWSCRCDCGTQKLVDGQSLRNGHSPGCIKCRPTENYGTDLLGKRFGKLIAVRMIPSRVRGKRLWECRCDCGNTHLVQSQSLISGHSKSCGCNTYKRGKDHSMWKGGRRLNDAGYVLLSDHRGHPNANRHGTIREHIFVMSEFLGRPIAECETVHHRNTIRHDNRIDNLQLRTGQHGPGGTLEDIMDFWMSYIQDHLHDYALLNPGFSRDQIAKLGKSLLDLSKSSPPGFPGEEVA
jgi:hypothetical protein